MLVTKIINVSKTDEFEEVFDLFKNTEAEDVIFIFPRNSRFAKQEQYFEAIKDEADSSGKKVSIMTADPVVIRFAAQNDFDILGSPTPQSQKRRSEFSGPADESVDEQVEEQVDEQGPELPEVPIAPEPVTPEPAEETGPEEPLESPETPVAQEPVEETGPEEPMENFAETRPEPVVDTMVAGEEPEAVLTAAANDDQEAIEGSQSRMIKDIFPGYTDHSLEVKRERERTFEVDIENRAGRTGGRTGDIGKIWAAEEKRKQHNFLTSASSIKPRKFFKKVSLLLIVVAALVLILALYITLGHAQIIIRPQTQKVDFDLKVSASSTTTAVNFDFNQIPGQHFKDQEEKSGTFPVTGSKDVVQKSSGKITIFNKGTSAQRLVATTRFKTSDGLIFRIPQTIIVPPATKTGSTLTPGSIESAVSADKPGADYNIGPAQFTIPGLEGTPKFDDFYAVSNQPMTGGIIGPAKVVTEEDFAKAQETLAAEVKDEISKSLKEQSGELEILDTFAIKIEAPGTNAKVGDAAENLRMSVKGSADTVAFREADIVELAKKFVSDKDNLNLLPKDLSVTFLNPVSSADNSLISFDVKIDGSAAAKVDKNAILKEVAGMSESSITSYFKGVKEVESARIKLSPFWVRSIPKNPDKIDIDVVTD